MWRCRFVVLELAIVGVLGGCANADAPLGEEIAQTEQAIFKGKPDNQTHPQIIDLIVPLKASFEVGCTGTLISSRVILTAAHCAKTGDSADAPLDTSPQSFRVLLDNLDDARKATFLASVPTPEGLSAGALAPSQVLVHPSYEPARSPAYDVMLLVFPSPIPRSVMKPLRVSGGYGSGLRSGRRTRRGSSGWVRRTMGVRSRPGFRCGSSTTPRSRARRTSSASRTGAPMGIRASATQAGRT